MFPAIFRSTSNKTKLKTNNEYSVDIFIVASDHIPINHQKPLPAYIDFKNQTLGIRFSHQWFHQNHVAYINNMYNLQSLTKVEHLSNIDQKILLPNVKQKTRNRSDFFKKFATKLGKSPAAKGKALLILYFQDGKILIVAANQGLVPLLHKTANLNNQNKSSNHSADHWVHFNLTAQNPVYPIINNDFALACEKARINRAFKWAISCNFLFLIIVLIAVNSPAITQYLEIPLLLSLFLSTALTIFACTFQIFTKIHSYLISKIQKPK